MTEEKLVNLSLRIKDSAAILKLGTAYYRKKGRTEEDLKKAASYYIMAADMGNANAACRAGGCYLYGQGVELDLNRAFYYLSIAAQAENIRALYQLGDFYMKGWGGAEVDEEKAVACYERAYQRAEERSLEEILYPDICLKLADCYFNGIVKEKDYRMALKLYENAEFCFDCRIVGGDRFSDDKLRRATEGIEKCRKFLGKK